MACERCEELPGTLPGLVGWQHFHGTAPCWWLVKEVYARHLGVVLSVGNVLVGKEAWSSMIDEHTNEWVKVVQPRAYDLFLIRFRWGDHIGLYDGDGGIVHYFSEKSGIVRTPSTRMERHAVGYFTLIQK